MPIATTQSYVPPTRYCYLLAHGVQWIASWQQQGQQQQQQRQEEKHNKKQQEQKWYRLQHDNNSAQPSNMTLPNKSAKSHHTTEHQKATLQAWKCFNKPTIEECNIWSKTKPVEITGTTRNQTKPKPQNH